MVGRVLAKLRAAGQAVGRQFYCVRRPSTSATISWMWNTSRKFLRLPWELKRFVLRSVLILPIAYAGLRLFGLKPLLTGIQRVAPIRGRVSDRCPEEIGTY